MDNQTGTIRFKVNHIQQHYTRIDINESMSLLLNNNDLSLKTINCIKLTLDEIESGEDNSLGGELFENIAELYYLNGWLFYKLKNSDDYNVFIYNKLVSDYSIEVIESLIFTETT